MANQHDRGGRGGESHQPPDPKRRQTTGGNMGAGRSGSEDLGSEKPSERDNMGSRKPKRRGADS